VLLLTALHTDRATRAALLLFVLELAIHTFVGCAITTATTISGKHLLVDASWVAACIIPLN